MHNRTYNFVHSHKIYLICIAHVISSYLYPEFNEIFLGKIASHLQGPGEQVDQGLGGVHHDPQFFLFCSFFTAYEWYAIVNEKL